MTLSKISQLTIKSIWLEQECWFHAQPLVSLYFSIIVLLKSPIGRLIFIRFLLFL